MIGGFIVNYHSTITNHLNLGAQIPLNVLIYNDWSNSGYLSWLPE